MESNHPTKCVTTVKILLEGVTEKNHNLNIFYEKKPLNKLF